MRAVKHEALVAVAHHWGDGGNTLKRLAAALECAISELLTAAGRREFQRIGGDAEASLAAGLA